MSFRAVLPALFLAALIAGCDANSNPDEIAIAFIGEPDSLFEKGLRLSPAGQHARAATVEGLVSLDAAGEIVPGLAERWIVTDDGLSYIFRLRDSDWPDGEPITGEAVRDKLRGSLRELRGTSLALDLAPVSEVRAMTGRVVEIRLSSPMPDLLRLLAQPELGIAHRGSGTGPMQVERDGDVAIFTPLPPERRGLPAQPGWKARTLRVQAMTARHAVSEFSAGRVDLVLDGRLATLPLADVGPLSRGTVRLDAARGLFGLRVVDPRGFLADAARREALAMAIDRETLMTPFNIAGWIPTSRLVADGLPGDPGTIGERWEGLSLEQRRAEAARRVSQWESGNAEQAVVRVALPRGPGSRVLFDKLAADWREIGVGAVLVEPDANADLRLLDTLARFADARWYLDQFACPVRRTLCSEEADALVRAASAESDPLTRAALLAEAEAELTALNGFVPLGSPIRWSLVRGEIEGFVENPWSLHPLFPLSQRPI